MPPRVHLSELVPVEVEQALAADFELVPQPRGADGIVAMLTVTVDDAFLEAAGPQLRDRRQLRRRGQQRRPRGRPSARDRRLEHARRPHRRDGRDRADADALAVAPRDGGRPLRPPPRAVAVLARVHAGRAPRGEARADRRRRPDRARNAPASPRRSVPRPSSPAAMTIWTRCCRTPTLSRCTCR